MRSADHQKIMDKRITTRWLLQGIGSLATVVWLGCSTLEAGQVDPSASHDKGEVLHFSPSSGSGLFDAFMDGGTLWIELRVFYAWLDGDPDRMPGYEAAAYTWTDELKIEFRRAFSDRVARTWSGAFPVESTDRQQRLRVEVRVETVSRVEQAHWRIEVVRYPDDGPDAIASVCPPGHFHLAGGCEANAADRRWGTVRLASSHLRAEHVRDLELPPYDLWFGVGSAEKPDLSVDPVARLIQIPEWQIRLTSFAEETEVDARRQREDARPSVDLARERGRNVHEALVDLACSNGRMADPHCRSRISQRITIRNLGAYGETPDVPRRFVRLELFRTPPIDTLAHEAGHMLGLGDEASGPTGGVGAPLVDAGYAAFVAWQTGFILQRVDDDNIMSRGTVVRPWHYSPFVEALEAMPGSGEWQVVEKLDPSGTEQ